MTSVSRSGNRRRFARPPAPDVFRSEGGLQSTSDVRGPPASAAFRPFQARQIGPAAVRFVQNVNRTLGPFGFFTGQHPPIYVSMSESHPRLANVLVASDLSTGSDQVIQAAAKIAKFGGGDLHVVSAYHEVAGGPTRVSGELSEQVRAEVGHALPAQLRRVLSGGSPPATQEVRFGPPATVILDRAREITADLIVLGVHRGTDLEARFLGTTADSVLAASAVPCLVISGRIDLPFCRVGVAVSLTEAAAHTVERAIEFITRVDRGDTQPGREALVVSIAHVANPRESNDTTNRQRLEEIASGARAAIATPLIADVTVRLIEGGDPATSVAEWVDQEGADLIILGTRDRPHVQGSHLGSVSSAIARHSSCPVLLIPPPE